MSGTTEQPAKEQERQEPSPPPSNEEIRRWLGWDLVQAEATRER
jgi:hypothetical protein